MEVSAAHFFIVFRSLCGLISEMWRNCFGCHKIFGAYSKKICATQSIRKKVEVLKLNDIFFCDIAIIDKLQCVIRPIQNYQRCVV